MEVPPPPRNPLYDLWLNTQVNAATLDTMMKYIGHLLAETRGVPYEEVRHEMEADRDRRVREYMRENRSK